MFNCQRIMLFAFAVVLCLIQVGYSAEQISDASEISVRQTETQSNPLVFEEGITYSVTAGSNARITYKPVESSAVDLAPMVVEYSPAGITVSENKRVKSEFLVSDTGDELAKTSSGSIKYSAMFVKTTGAWRWAYNYNYNDFVSLLNTYKNDGYRIESFDVYPEVDNVSSKYAGTWYKDTQGWAYGLNYNFDDFVNLLNTYGGEGRRITDIEFDKRNRNWSGVWVTDTRAWRWAINYNYTDFVQLLQTQQNEGNRPLDFNIALNSSNSSLLYSGVWVGNSEGYGWAWAFNQNWSDFSDLLDSYHGDGFRLIDYEKYVSGNDILYAGIWVDDNVGGAYSINYSSTTDFNDRIEDRKNNSFRPIKFEMFTELSTAIADDAPQNVSTFKLAQNYPNPFNPVTNIRYNIPESEHVMLKIYDLLGNEVATLINSDQDAGQHIVQFDASQLASGIYLYRIVAGDFVQTRKCMVLK